MKQKRECKMQIKKKGKQKGEQTNKQKKKGDNTKQTKLPPIKEKFFVKTK